MSMAVDNAWTKPPRPSAQAITSDLYARLARRIANAPGEILIREVGNGAGSKNSGWVDAISMQTWPSKGLAITGYELKATRQDWLRELDNPEKNRAWQGCADMFYIVAPKGIVEILELPHMWGLMIPSGDALRIQVRAQWDGKSSTSVPYGMVAAIFRAIERDRTAHEAEVSDRKIRSTIEAFEKKHAAERLARHKAETELCHLAALLGVSRYDMSGLEKRAELFREFALTENDPIVQLECTYERLRSAKNRIGMLLTELAKDEGKANEPIRDSERDH